MFFILYKFILGFLMGPGFFVLTLAFGALFINFLKKGDKKQNKKLRFISIFLLANSLFLYLITIEPVKDCFAYMIENKYMPINIEKIKNVDVIVVLGSGINDYAYTSFASAREDEGTPSYTALARLTEAVKIYNKSKKISPLIIVH